MHQQQNAKKENSVESDRPNKNQICGKPTESRDRFIEPCFEEKRQHQSGRKPIRNPLQTFRLMEKFLSNRECHPDSQKRRANVENDNKRTPDMPRKQQNEVIPLKKCRDQYYSPLLTTSLQNFCLHAHQHACQIDRQIFQVIHLLHSNLNKRKK